MNHCLMKSILRVRLLLLIALIMAYGAIASQSCADTILIAPKTLMPDGTLAEGKAVVVDDDGTIDRVINADQVSDDVDVVRFDSGVLSPGLIDVNTYLGVRGQNVERANAIDPGVRAADGFDPTALDLQRAMRAGVTAAMISPAPTNVVAGRTAVVSTHVADGIQAIVLDDDAGVSIVLSSSTFSPDRPPSTRAGAMNLLRQAFSDEESAMPSDARYFVTCEEGQDVLNAIAFFGPREVEPIIMHTRDLTGLANRIGEAEVTVVVGPYSFYSDDTTLKGAARVHDAGGRVVVSGQTGASGPDAVRITAALAALHGLDPAVARQAMTSRAAEVSGAADQIGSIASGKRADLVLFSGDPLRLDSNVVEVWINGERTWSASSQTYDHESVIGATHD